jgi:hypothetical protein
MTFLIATFGHALPELLGGALFLAGGIAFAVWLGIVAARSGGGTAFLLRVAAIIAAGGCLYVGGLLLVIGVATIGCNPGDYECPL